MAIQFQCASCGKQFRTDDSTAGRSGKCKQCGASFVIPQPTEDLEPSAAESDLSTPVTSRRWLLPFRFFLVVMVLLGGGIGVYLGSRQSLPPAVTPAQPPNPIAPDQPVLPQPPVVAAAAVAARPLVSPPVAIGEIRRFEGHSAGVSGVAYAPDGLSAISGGADKVPRIWNLATGQEIHQFRGDIDNLWGVAFAPDGRHILAGSSKNVMMLWDAADDRLTRRFAGDNGVVTLVAFSPDSKFAASGSEDKFARVWDVATGKIVRQFEHGALVVGVAFAPDGKRLATGSWDKTARLWDVATGNEIQRFLGHTDKVGAVVYAQDGRRILSGSTDRTMRLWNVETGREVSRFDVEADTGWSIDLSPDGRRSLSVHGNNVDLWENATQQRLISLAGHTDQVKSVRFAPDGLTALSASQDGTIRLWGLPPADYPPPRRRNRPPRISLARSTTGSRSEPRSTKSRHLWPTGT